MILPQNSQQLKKILILKKIHYKITLTDVSNRQKYRKAQDISSVIASDAEKQQLTKNELMGMVIHKINYKVDKSATACGAQEKDSCNT